MANPNYVAVAGKGPTPIGKVNFPSVFEVDDKGKYSLMLVFEKADKDKPEFKALIASLNTAAKERFEVESYTDDYKGVKLKSPFKTSDHYDFLEEDEVAIRLKSKFRPEIVDADGETYLTDSEGFYSGCLARATYSATAYDKDGNRGLSFQLDNLQKAGAGTRYVGTRKKAKDEFGSVEMDESLQEMPEGDIAF